MKIYNNLSECDGLPSISIEKLNEHFHVKLFEDVSFVWVIGDFIVSSYTIQLGKIVFPMGELRFKRLVDYE
jgi:hypothetical protein